MAIAARYGHRDLSPAEVTVPSLWNGLVRAWVPALQGGDVIVEDSSFGGIITVHQGTVVGPKRVPTSEGYALSLTGGNWWTGIQSNFDEQSDFTLVIHFLGSDMTAVFGFLDRRLFSQSAGSGTGRDWLWVDDTGTFLLKSSFPGVNVTGPFDIVENRWYVGGLTYDSSARETKVWIDGIAGSGVINVAENATGNHLIGAPNVTTGFNKWKGFVGSTYMWQRLLSDSEMKALVPDPMVLFQRDDFRSESNVPVAGLTVLDWERKLRGGMRGGVRGGL